MIAAHRRVRAVLPAATLLGLGAVASLLVGSVPVTPGATIAAWRDGADPLHALVTARAERTALAAVVGAALGLAGALLQGLTRNPLADPGILGISSGAALAMVLALGTLGLSAPPLLVLASALGAATAAVLVHGLAALSRGGTTPTTIVIAGAAVTAALTSLTTALLLGDHGTLDAFRAWQVGSVGGRDLHLLGTALPVVVLAAALALAHARALDALALGDDVAVALGTHPARTRWVVGALAVLLAGAAVALAGPIGFVGLLVPHAARSLAGPAHGVVLTLSAVLGAALVLLADTVGRVVLPPAEVQVGIMTAVIGLPGFVWAVRGGRR